MKLFKKLLFYFVLIFLSFNFLTIDLLPLASIPKDEIYLTLDSSEKNELPSNFRKTTDLSILSKYNLNTVGLSELNISGSAQFSLGELKKILINLNKQNIVDVDLRQESHGFINGNAISWHGIDDKANRGLSFSEVIVKEASQLSNIKLFTPISIDLGKYNLTPTEVKNEDSLIKPFNLTYLRLTVTDNERPTDDMVDKFINFINNMPKDTWLHFHCKEGIGRTTTFMSMYDMIKNSKNVTFNEILDRQQYLAKLSVFILDKADPRLVFLQNFYNYTKDNNDNFKSTWSNYVKSNNLTPYTNKSELPKKS